MEHEKNPHVVIASISVARTDAEAPTLWPPDAKRQVIEKDPDAGKD